MGAHRTWGDWAMGVDPGSLQTQPGSLWANNGHAVQASRMSSPPSHSCDGPWHKVLSVRAWPQAAGPEQQLLPKRLRCPETQGAQ